MSITNHEKIITVCPCHSMFSTEYLYTTKTITYIETGPPGATWAGQNPDKKCLTIRKAKKCLGRERHPVCPAFGRGMFLMTAGFFRDRGAVLSNRDRPSMAQRNWGPWQQGGSDGPCGGI